MGRASKRQQRAKDQLKELGYSNDDSLDELKDEHLSEEEEEENAEKEEEDEVLNSAFSKSFNAFASLGDQEDQFEDDDDEDEDQDDKEEEFSNIRSTVPKKTGAKKKSKSKKKSKKTLSNGVIRSITNDQDERFSSDSIKPLKKTKKDSDGDGKISEVDEIEQALKELGLSNPTLDSRNGSLNELNQLDVILSRICSVEGKMLDADQELRRMFGSRVVSSALNSTRSTPTPYHPRISNNPHHQVNLRSKTAFLAKPQATWQPFDKISVGLSMKANLSEEGEMIKKTDCSQEVSFTFEHSPRFKATQLKFIQAVMSHDPNRLMSIFQGAPYHPDTLLQLSDVSAQQGDQGQALDFLNRALYSFERCFNPLFNISKGLVRLDFKRVENRGFFRAVEKSMQLLARRGCWRTALETCKLLLAMDPYEDPYGALLWIDFLAPKAKQYEYFLYLAEHFDALEGWGLPRTGYAGFAYATALCRWHHEEEQNKSHEISTKELETAIIRFPQVISPLSEKLGISLPKRLSAVKRAAPRSGFIQEDHLIYLQANTYVTRSSDLWKEPDVLSWFQTTLSACHHRLNDDKDLDVIEGQRLAQQYLSDSTIGIYRTVVLSGTIWFVMAEKDHLKIKRVYPFTDLPALKVFLPPKLLGSVGYSFDPLPPLGGTTYDAEYFKDTDTSASEPRRAANQQDGVRHAEDQGALHEILNRIIEAGFGGNREEVEERIQQLQLTLQADDGSLTPEQREIILNLLDGLLARLRDREDGEEEDEDGREDAEDLEDPTNRDSATEDEDESSDQMNTDRNGRAMPGSFQDDDNPSVDEEPRENQPSMIDRLWRWVG
ncbi:transcriptional repressor TCF25-domain-containing protein [Melampsora americana]|nr:transcriptional repressor TCF25-domain-containing protein [Melampsora americana]